MPTLDECFFFGCHLTEKIVKILLTTWPGHAVQLLSCSSSNTYNTFHALFFNISVNTFSCSWPEDEYRNWLSKWVTWPLLRQLSISLNLYNTLKLLPKFPINVLHIYRDRPPPSFFHVVYVTQPLIYPFHIRSVSSARTASRSSQNSWFTSKRTARHAHAGTFLEHWLADYDVNLPNAN